MPTTIQEERQIGTQTGIPRREFLMSSMAAASMAGAAAGIAGGRGPTLAAEARPSKATGGDGRMGVGINLEYVRHGDKSLAYGIKKAGEIGYQWVEPCFLDGRCLLSNAGYCHVTSMDTDPQLIKDMCSSAGVKISAVSSHSDLLNPEYGVLYARRGIRYAKALGVDIVQICEDMHPPKWIDETTAYNIMRVNLKAISETCEENGVYLGVEQHGPYTGKIDHMKRVLSLVDSPWIKCNYDCGNTFLAGSDPYDMLEAVIDKVVHVHAKDISVKQAEKERGKVTGTAVGCACGDGVIDWKRLIGRLKKAGFKGVLSVECGTEDESVRSLAHLNKVLKELDA
ncbi:MAG TPA: sugar phosphate isomerase/epimerase [Phycisphaerae bacterium]|nr:sugar phosphate isomerase/epimerase [Phycisphaerae bacterium]HRY68265.1 sugar phosphate isomerase/epimerase [Phycisphaerae bacterium]HSA26852.1 sugar phosphate isomerase/epimerase [Phycisphaerae bacterium]